MKDFRGLLKLTCVMALLMFGSGCAVNRGILDIQVPPASDPGSSNVVAITKITDSRKFELRPMDPSTPSLKDGQIDNPAITSRAIARKRNGWGQALGDILLPEGRTVSDLVREAVTKALMEKGYSVAPSGSSGGIPMEVDIEQFWAWTSQGGWSIHLMCESVLEIKSSVLTNSQSERVKGYVLLNTQGATGRAWANTINKGIEKLVAEIKIQLRSP